MKVFKTSCRFCVGKFQSVEKVTRKGVAFLSKKWYNEKGEENAAKGKKRKKSA